MLGHAIHGLLAAENQIKLEYRSISIYFFKNSGCIMQLLLTSFFCFKNMERHIEINEEYKEKHKYVK